MQFRLYITVTFSDPTNQSVDSLPDATRWRFVGDAVSWILWSSVYITASDRFTRARGQSVNDEGCAGIRFVLIRNCRSLSSICCTFSLESAAWFIPSASTRSRFISHTSQYHWRR